MIIASRGNRRVGAMLLNTPVNDVVGIVQCLIDGCQAHIALMNDDFVPREIETFLDEHECDKNRFPGKPATKLVQY